MGKNFMFKFNKFLRLLIVSACRQMKIVPIEPHKTFVIYEGQAKLQIAPRVK